MIIYLIPLRVSFLTARILYWNLNEILQKIEQLIKYCGFYPLNIIN